MIQESRISSIDKLKLGYANKLNKAIESFLSKVEQVEGWKLVLGVVTLSIVYNVFSANIVAKYMGEGLKTPGLEGMSQVELFFMVVLITPMIETLIFQSSIIELAAFGGRKYELIGVVASSMVFAFSHSYSIVYILVMILPGLMLSLLYLTFKRRKLYDLPGTCLYKSIYFVA